jgi:hypothetical protein
LRRLCSFDWEAVPVQIVVSWWQMPAAWRVVDWAEDSGREGEGFASIAVGVASVAVKIKILSRGFCDQYVRARYGVQDCESDFCYVPYGDYMQTNEDNYGVKPVCHYTFQSFFA